MPRKKSAGQSVFSFAVFVILEIAALLLLSNNSSLQRLWVARASHGVTGSVWGSVQGITDYFGLKKKNAELAQENTNLSALVKGYEKALKEMDPSFRPELKSDGFHYLPATVLKGSTNSQHNYLILDKGSEDGVERNSGVITRNGVIGIVDAVSKHYSYAISFLNTEMSISARIGDSGAVGSMTWDGLGTNGAVLKEIPLQFKFEPGDTVFTSGYSTIFPPDIPIGVTGEARVINGATNEVKINLFQDHSTLKHVTIVRNSRIEEIESLEKSQEEEKKK